MNTKRLLKLADFLDTVPRKNFEISAWVKREADKPEGEVPGECGFAGCAMGWAGHAKLFRDLRIRDGKSLRVWRFTYKGRGMDGFEAGKRVFEIDYGASEYLFDPWSYENLSATPKQVSARIRAFVESNGSIR